MFWLCLWLSHKFVIRAKSREVFRRRKMQIVQLSPLASKEHKSTFLKQLGAEYSHGIDDLSLYKVSKC